MDDKGTRIRLPIIRSFADTFRLIFGNLGFLARQGLPWLATVWRITLR